MLPKDDDMDLKQPLFSNSAKSTTYRPTATPARLVSLVDGLKIPNGIFSMGKGLPASTEMGKLTIVILEGSLWRA